MLIINTADKLGHELECSNYDYCLNKHTLQLKRKLMLIALQNRCVNE